MERVARVLISMDDAEIATWIREEEITRDEVIGEVKDDFRAFIEKYHGNGPLSKLEFIEFENFCPKCEDTDLKTEVDRESHTFRQKYTCNNCEYQFKEGEMGE